MPVFSNTFSQLGLIYSATYLLKRLVLCNIFLRWLFSHEFKCITVPTDEQMRPFQKSPPKAPPAGRKGKHKHQRHHGHGQAGHSHGHGHSHQQQQHGHGHEHGHQHHHHHSVPHHTNPFPGLPEVSSEEFSISTSSLCRISFTEVIVDFKSVRDLLFSQELEWFVDLSLMALVSYVCVELQFYFYPISKDYNFSTLWVALVIIYGIRLLFLVTSATFFCPHQAHDRDILGVSTFFFIGITIYIFSFMDEKTYELGLEDSYGSLNKSATLFMREYSLRNYLSRGRFFTAKSKLVSLPAIKLLLAPFCVLLGTFMTYSGFRFAQLHKALLERGQMGSLMHLLLTFNYISPILICTLWAKPFFKTHFGNMNEEVYNTLRIYIVIGANILRFYLMPYYFHMYFNSYPVRIMRLKFYGAETTNQMIQMSVRAIYKFFSFAAVQYLVPIIVCLFITILYTAMGELSWLPFGNIAHNSTSPEYALDPDDYKPVIEKLNKYLGESTTTDMLELKKVFTPIFFRGALSFATWYFHLVWFITCSAGLIYYHVFSDLLLY